MAIETEYRGFKIEFNEHSESWSCELSESKFYSKDKLSDVKKRIDKFIKDESDFKDMEVVVSGGWRSNKPFRRVIITSISDNGDIWIKHNKQREKLYDSEIIYKITDKNESLIKQYMDNIERINLIQSENEDIKNNQMEQVNIKE